MERGRTAIKKQRGMNGGGGGGLEGRKGEEKITLAFAFFCFCLFLLRRGRTGTS